MTDLIDPIRQYDRRETTQMETVLDRHPRPVRSQRRHERRSKCLPLPKCTETTITEKGSNDDEQRFGAGDPFAFIGNYHKGLPHDMVGQVVPADYQTFVGILQAESGFPNIPQASTVPPGQRKLVNPQAGLATDLEGPPPQSLEMLAAPSVDSAEAAAEAVELYWMALLRDVPFIEFGADQDVAAAADEISDLDDFTGPKKGNKVTPRTIFRGCSGGDLDGPYLSQFLLHDIPFGTLTIPQRQATVVQGLDYMTEFDQWLKVQNGQVRPGDVVDAVPRYIRSMRDLGRYVHIDALYEAYLNACLILLGHDAPFDRGNPYVGSHPDAANQIGFGTFGGPHVLSLVTEVATRALKAMWWQKWFVHRRLRPEAYGGLIHVKKVGVCGTTRDYPIHQQILGSKALEETEKRWGTCLLPMAFPEGSPMHPSYGAGHATVAGACVTILKAFFDDLACLPDSLAPKVADADGTALVEYDGKGADELTIGGELNKLAANISIGRNMAGVHWRSDYTESIRLGEQVALSILCKQRNDYHEKDWSFSLCTFDGHRVKVDHDGVHGKYSRPLSCDD